MAPHLVRLIAIYTNTPNLWTIANSILQHLQGIEINVEPIDESRFRLQAGSTRIIILGKTGGITRAETEMPFTIREADLANKLLAEFAAMNQGILPSCALLGMAAVRQNSRRILDKFRSDLDGQFLLHRALVRSSEEAFDQLPELLGDEFKAVIEDTDYRPDEPTTFVVESCAEIPVKPHSSPWKVGGVACETVLKEFWSKDNGICKALSGKKVDKDDGDQPKKPAESLAVMCSVNDTEAHQRFAALLAVRTQYQAKHRTLGCGVVVMNRSTQKYSVCIIPTCDSLRLKVATAFPFWNLSTSGRGNPVIIQREDHKLLKLVFELGKPSLYMWMGIFMPNPTKGVVIAKGDQGGKHVYTSNDSEFEWVAQLKPSHAQRIANAVGQQLSRVGLTEAEWARITFANE